MTMEFAVNDKVIFGRNKGEKTLGQIVKVGRSRYQIKQLESRGTMRAYPIGTVWTVAPSLVTRADDHAPVARPTIPRTTPSTFEPKDKVKFLGPNGNLITGTVARVNTKTVTVTDTSDGTRGWRVPPSRLQHV